MSSVPPTASDLSCQKRALVADDDPSARRFFTRLLQLDGFEVTAAVDGAQAASFLSDGPFDVVLSDITMPGMGGIQLLQAIREVDEGVPVILITGDPTIDTAAKAVEHGALRYLVKPVKAQLLRDCVRQAVHMRTLARIQQQAVQLGAPAAPIHGSLESSFDRALELLWIAYQPIVQVSAKAPHAYEALVRSRDPDLPSPGHLLEAAEKLGRIHDLGRAIREQIAFQASNLADGQDLFVNLHPDELEDDLLYSRHSPLAPYADRIVLEVTERARVETIGRLEERIQRLRDAGYRFAIDDLGAGYAGLQSFVFLRPDVVKIDMGLIRSIDTDPTRERIVRSIHDLCRDMNIKVVAEGVETVRERDRISEVGIDLLQGYFFARPSEGFVDVPVELFRDVDEGA